MTAKKARAKAEKLRVTKESTEVDTGTMAVNEAMALVAALEAREAKRKADNLRDEERALKRHAAVEQDVSRVMAISDILNETRETGSVLPAQFYDTWYASSGRELVTTGTQVATGNHLDKNNLAFVLRATLSQMESRNNGAHNSFTCSKFTWNNFTWNNPTPTPRVVSPYIGNPCVMIPLNGGTTTGRNTPLTLVVTRPTMETVSVCNTAESRASIELLDIDTDFPSVSLYSQFPVSTPGDDNDEDSWYNR